MRAVGVDQITDYLKDLIDSDPLMGDVWIRGDVTSWFESSAGHCYFTLSGQVSQMKAVLFKGNRWSLASLPVQGDEIIAHGRVSVYPDQGLYQLYVDYVAPEGVGIFQAQFEQLYQQLESEGLFELSRKRPIPILPETIGVVTSAQGAVWHDIQTVVRRRYPGVILVLASSAVQGNNAPDQIVNALSRLEASGQCDVIIIARGGGSPEELAAFNDERVARSIFRSTVPIVSAVGHETDTTISDLVADLRAPTPSAAAEMILPDRREIARQISARIVEARDSVESLLAGIDVQLSRRIGQLNRLVPARTIDRSRQSVDFASIRAETAVRRSISTKRQALESRIAGAHALDPAGVLRRGYAVVEDSESGRRVRSATQLAEALGGVNIQFHDGVVRVIEWERSARGHER